MQKKKGISLIVLVITIIVMIILAAAVIISLNNNGIIGNAKEAVDKTNEKQVQEIANLAWGEAYTDYLAMTETEKEEVGSLKEYATDKIKASLEANGLKPSEHGMEVTDSGVAITKGWLQKANRTVVKGDTVLNIGTDITYDETNGGTITGLTDVDWKVLGAENGELLIMSTTIIKDNYTLGSSSDFSVAKTDYETGISKLNELCVPYGKGTYATGARSITVEDVDKVTGYDKTTYGKGKINEYGNVVTYKYNGTNKPAYVGSNGVSGTLSSTHSSGFHWYDVNKVYHNVSASDLTNTENNGKEITKLTSTYYYYDVDEETDLAKGTDAYNMLFGSYDGNYYWLASSYVDATSYYAYFGLRSVSDGNVYDGGFVNSNGVYRGNSRGVRAVVYLSSEFNL